MKSCKLDGALLPNICVAKASCSISGGGGGIYDARAFAKASCSI